MLYSALHAKPRAKQNLSIKGFLELFKADVLQNKILKYFVTTEQKNISLQNSGSHMRSHKGLKENWAGWN